VKRARLEPRGMALQPPEVKLTPRPALVERVTVKGVPMAQAAVGTGLQLWARGRVRKFARPCKLCGWNVRLSERCWHPADPAAQNRADRVCFRCWPSEAQKGKELP
jgi:hypothetical protein